MKGCKVSLFLALLVGACLPAVAVEPKMQLDIPFNFVVAGKAMPAGHYMVTPVFNSDNTAWRMCSNDACATVLTRSEESVQTAHRRTMVFESTSEGYAVVQFWPTGHYGRALTMPNVRHTLIAERDKYVEVVASK